MSDAQYDLVVFGRQVSWGGSWTPSTTFGDHLLERLTRHAGLSFEVLG